MTETNTGLEETKDEQSFFSGLVDGATPEAETPAGEPASKPVEKAGPEAKAEAPKPETKPDVKADAGAPKPDPEKARRLVRKVDFGAFHEERMRRKQAESEKQELQRQIIELKKNPLPAEPDKEKDPEAHIQWRAQNAERELKMLQEQQDKTSKSAQEAEQRNRVLTRYRESAAEIAEEIPNFVNYVQEAVKIRGRELLEIYGYTVDQAQETILNEETFMAAKALNEGKDPAREVLRMLKIRYPGLDDIVKGKKMTEEKMDTLAKGQAAAKSAGKAGGPAKPDLTMEELASMEGESFDKGMAKLFPGSDKRLRL